MFMISEQLLPPRGSASRYELLAALSLVSLATASSCTADWQEKSSLPVLHGSPKWKTKNGSPVTFHNVSDGETDEKENLDKPVDERSFVPQPLCA